MSALEQLALAGQALWLTLREIRAGRLWVPWLALGALLLAALMALVGFAHPLLSWAVAPLVRAIGGEPALHYPDFYRTLPFLYSRVDLVLGTLAGAVATGWSTRALARATALYEQARGEISAYAIEAAMSRLDEATAALEDFCARVARALPGVFAAAERRPGR